MFVFLVLLMLYPNGTLAGFAKATKTCPAAAMKFEEKPSCVKMNFLFFEFLCRIYIYIFKSKSNHLTPRCACVARGN